MMTSIDEVRRCGIPEKAIECPNAEVTASFVLPGLKCDSYIIEMFLLLTLYPSYTSPVEPSAFAFLSTPFAGYPLYLLSSVRSFAPCYQHIPYWLLSSFRCPSKLPQPLK